MVVRKPADAFLQELGIPFEDEGNYVSSTMSVGNGTDLSIPSTRQGGGEACCAVHFHAPVEGSPGSSGYLRAPVSATAEDEIVPIPPPNSLLCSASSTSVLQSRSSIKTLVRAVAFGALKESPGRFLPSLELPVLRLTTLVSSSRRGEVVC